MVLPIHVCFSKTLIACHRTPRIRQEGLGPSIISATLPKNVPVDFFTPEFFNKLSVRERADYVDAGVLLPPAEFCQTWEEIEKWKGLSQSEFMAKYGNAKLASYKIPSYEELDRLAKEDAMDE